jgi:hypothetical protein
MKISQDKFESRLNDLEKQCSSVCVSKPTSASAKPAAAKPAAKPTAKKDDDDDVDLFGSESEVAIISCATFPFIKCEII